jgi:hypothetical protein
MMKMRWKGRYRCTIEGAADGNEAYRLMMKGDGGVDVDVDGGVDVERRDEKEAS